MGYPIERRESVLKKMLPPHNVPVAQLARDEGISQQTLYLWRRAARNQGRLMPDHDTTPEGWSSADKFAAVLESAAMNEAELAEYCRSKGLYPEQVRAWRSACEQANERERESTRAAKAASAAERKVSVTRTTSSAMRTAR